VTSADAYGKRNSGHSSSGGSGTHAQPGYDHGVHANGEPSGDYGVHAEGKSNDDYGHNVIADPPDDHGNHNELGDDKRKSGLR
jgi:hypothetical protein